MPQPVVFIPGFPASELLQVSDGNRVIFPPTLQDLASSARKEEILDLLEGPDDPAGDIVAGEPIRSVLRLGRLEIGKRAQALYDLLRNNYGYTLHSGNNLRAIGWDWRRAVDDARVQQDVRDAIDELFDATGTKVVALVHSTGGLVLRRLLEAQPLLAQRIEHILALGVPWAGTLVAVDELRFGHSIGFGPFSFKAAEVRRVMMHAQAAYDLFPPDPGKTDLTAASGNRLDLVVGAKKVAGKRPQIGLLVDDRWMPSGTDFDFMRDMAADSDDRLGARTSELQLPNGDPHPPVTNVVGWGVEMDTTCAMDADGVLSFEESKEGDGTVPAASASWLRGSSDRFRTVFVPIGIYPVNQIPFHHNLVWDSPPLRQIFNEVLQDSPRGPYVCGSADADEASDPESDVTLRLVAADALGQPLPDSRYKVRNVMTRAKSFGGRVRLDLVVKQQNVHPDAQRMVRLVVEVSWTGVGGGDETREVVFLFRR